MRSAVALSFLILLPLVQGCSTDTAKRLTYESLQTRQRLECQSAPGVGCPEREPYDSYQQKRDEVEHND